MSIRLLPEEVASQIAAGEVVERPASVVKELMENAIDAGARHISITIEKAGQRLIEVADNGSGIPADEVGLAVGRHATSKLSNAEDLFHITTLGFRGEALASIASVSRMTLSSRTSDSRSGARMRVEAGRPFPLEMTGIPVGTVVRVEDLFYNVPARLKFLKKDLTERQQIDALVTRYALAYDMIRLHLIQDNKAVVQTSGGGDRREILSGLYGVDIARKMLEVNYEEEGLKITGFTSPLAVTRSNRREITFFVNGRWVQDTAISAALIQAYQTLLMVGRYPMAILFLDISPEEVDVNVHPAKSEVRFRSHDRIFSCIQRAVKRSLLAYSPVQQLSPSYWKPQLAMGQGSHSIHPGIDPAWEMAANVPTGGEIQVEGQVEISSPDAQAALPSDSLPLLRLVGQVGATYLIAEGPDGLYLIDQHAAHERVLFERFKLKKPGPIPSQSLLEVVSFQLPPQTASLLIDQISLLNTLGFQVEAFGPASFLVRAIPSFLMGIDPVSALRVVVEEFEEDETPLQAEVENRLIARICKRAAVKGGTILTKEEQVALLHDLEICQSPRTCPHGRPTMIHLPVSLLERQFGRKGAR